MLTDASCWTQRHLIVQCRLSIQVPEERACVRVRVRLGRATKAVVVWSQSVDGAIGVAILTLLVDGLRIGGGRASVRQRSLVRYDRERTAWLTEAGGRQSQLSAVSAATRARPPQPGIGRAGQSMPSSRTADWAAAVAASSRLGSWPSQRSPGLQCGRL